MVLTYGIPPEFRGGVYTCMNTMPLHQNRGKSPHYTKIKLTVSDSSNGEPGSIVVLNSCTGSTLSRLARDGTAEPVSRDQILRRERGQGSINFPFSADHEQDW